MENFCHFYTFLNFPTFFTFEKTLVRSTVPWAGSFLSFDGLSSNPDSKTAPCQESRKKYKRDAACTYARQLTGDCVFR